VKLRTATRQSGRGTIVIHRAQQYPVARRLRTDQIAALSRGGRRLLFACETAPQHTPWEGAEVPSMRHDDVDRQPLVLAL